MTAIFLFLSEDIISYLPRKKTVFAKIALFSAISALSLFLILLSQQ